MKCPFLQCIIGRLNSKLFAVTRDTLDVLQLYDLSKCVLLHVLTHICTAPPRGVLATAGRVLLLAEASLLALVLLLAAPRSQLTPHTHVSESDTTIGRIGRLSVVRRCCSEPLLVCQATPYNTLLHVLAARVLPRATRTRAAAATRHRARLLVPVLPVGAATAPAPPAPPACPGVPARPRRP